MSSDIMEKSLSLKFNTLKLVMSDLFYKNILVPFDDVKMITPIKVTMNHIEIINGKIINEKREKKEKEKKTLPSHNRQQHTH